MIAKGERKGIFYGWWVAIACSVIYGLSGIGLYFKGIFSAFISAEMGWTEAQLGKALSVYLWVLAAPGFLTGYLVDRIGGQKTLIIGAVIACIGLVLLSTVTSFTQVIVYYSVIACVGITMESVLPTQAIARKWFVKRAGLVAGIIAGSFGILGALLFKLLPELAAVYGWRTILWQSAIAFEVIVILLAIFVVRDTPESIGLHPDGALESPTPTSQPAGHAPAEPCYNLRQALKTPQLWLIAIVFGFAAMVVVTYIDALQLWALKIGVEPGKTGSFAPYWLLPSIAARFGGGWLGDRLGKRRVIIAACAILVGVMIYGWLGVYSPRSLYAFSLAGGFFMIIPIVLATPLLGDLFGRRHLGTISGFLGIIIGVLGAAGPWLWGWIATTMGSYNPVLLPMAIGYAVSCVCVACIRPTEVEKETILKSHSDEEVK